MDISEIRQKIDANCEKTFQSKNTSRFKKICEYLPIHKMPETPVNTGYTGI